MSHVFHSILNLIRRLRPGFAFLVLSFFSASTFAQLTTAEDPVAALTLRQKAGQLFIFSYTGTTADGELNEILTSTTPGALIAFSRNISSLNQIAQVNAQAQTIAKQQTKLPLLIMVDEEGGNVARLKVRSSLPSALALGETNNAQLINRYGEAMAHFMVRLGFNVNLAPVLDLSNPLSISFIGPRSFGSQPVGVGVIANAFARGLAQGGLMPTAKHFPGHGGLAQDSHQVTPRKLDTLHELTEKDLVPFKYFADAKFPRAVMMAHISYPQIDPSGTPSAFSSVFIKKVLREKFHYDGLVITDDVEMSGAFIQGSFGEKIVRAIEAGNDMVMVASNPSRQKAAVQAIVSAVESGRIPIERIEESVRRIVGYKMKLQETQGKVRNEIAKFSLTDLQFNLESLANQVKRFNFAKTAKINFRLKGSMIHRPKLTVLAADTRFFNNFRQYYGSQATYLQLTPENPLQLQSFLLERPSEQFVYYASGSQTAKWLNQLTAGVKKRLVVVNTNQEGALDNRRNFRGVFQMNTTAPESGRWLAEFLLDPARDVTN